MALRNDVGFREGKETLAHTLLKHVSRFFRWAVDERRLKPTQFPLSGVRSRFKDKKRTRYFDPDEVRRLLVATNDPRTWLPERVDPADTLDRPACEPSFIAGTSSYSGTLGVVAAPWPR
jgi:hypothetical protein